MAEARTRPHLRPPLRIADASAIAGRDQRPPAPAAAARSGASMQACRSSPPAGSTRNADTPSPGGADRAILMRQDCRRHCASSALIRRPTLARENAPAIRCGEAGGDLALGHRRPVLDAVAIDQMDRVAVAAEDAGAGRDVVGEDPVAALLARASPSRWRRCSRSRRQSRRPAPAGRCRRAAMLARMSGFSMRRSAGGAAAVLLELLRATVSTRQSATAAAIPRHRRAVPPRRRRASRARSSTAHEPDAGRVGLLRSGPTPAPCRRRARRAPRRSHGPACPRNGWR